MKHKKGELPIEKSVKLTPFQIERVDELRDTIWRESFFVDIKPYSHNMISVCLREVAEIVDNGYANQLIDDFGLEKLGWSKVVESSNE